MGACFSVSGLQKAAQDFVHKPGYKRIRFIAAAMAVAGVAALLATASLMAGMYAAMAVSLGLFGQYKWGAGDSFALGFKNYDYITGKFWEQGFGKSYAARYPVIELAQAAVYCGAAFAASAGGHLAAFILVPALCVTAVTKFSESYGAYRAVCRGETAVCACVGGGDDAPPIGPVTVLENVAMTVMAVLMLLFEIV